MKEILIIEDDEILSGGLCYHLQTEGYATTPACDLHAARHCLSQTNYDLILLDINLPDGNGFAFCKEIRSVSSVPVMILTARDLDSEIMEGFALGADDYITKPFHVGILKKRVEAVLRRYGTVAHNPRYIDGPLQLNTASMSVTRNGCPLDLTSTEYRLLKEFMEHKNQVLTKQILLEQLWANDCHYVDDHTLAVNINRLRSKIDTDEHKWIKTIYGMGYLWISSEG